MTYRPTALLVVLFLACSSSGVWWSGSVARADAAIMVPPDVDEPLESPELVEEARAELMRLLRAQGFSPVSDGQAGPFAEADQQRADTQRGEQQRPPFPKHYDPMHCITPECAEEYRKLFDGALALQFFIASHERRATSVTVVITENPKAFFKGKAPIEGRDVRAAVGVAFEAARAKQKEGPGPWLTVSGSPEGAMVYVDGKEYGALPFTKRHIDAGEHRFEVRADSYTSDLRTLTVEGDVEHIAKVQVDLVRLTPVAAGEAGKHRRTRRRSVWDWALGGTLAAVGAVHLISGVYQKTRAGDCVDDSSPCSQRYQPNHRRENLLIGLGASGVALGAFVIGLGPIGQLQVRSGSDRASLLLEGKF
jgi:hypothetical protein